MTRQASHPGSPDGPDQFGPTRTKVTVSFEDLTVALLEILAA
jgi:hypothetical protein